MVLPSDIINEIAKCLKKYDIMYINCKNKDLKKNFYELLDDKN